MAMLIYSDWPLFLSLQADHSRLG